MNYTKFMPKKKKLKEKIGSKGRMKQRCEREIYAKDDKNSLAQLANQIIIMRKAFQKKKEMKERKQKKKNITIKEVLKSEDRA